MNIKIFNEIIQAVKNAKEKHPRFACHLFHSVSLATEELGEMAKALNDGNLEQMRAEALDTIAVLVRIMEMIEDEGYGTQPKN